MSAVETPDVLRRILRRKVEELEGRAQRRPLRELSEEVRSAPTPRGFRDALARVRAGGRPGLIAEVKHASPSRGVLCADFDPERIARTYEAAGATCLSVLTDETFFQGADAHLRAARAATSLPVLRKDFLVDPYQVYEARVLGADCVLLIVAALGDAQLQELHLLALELGMDVLVEVHDAEELERTKALTPVPDLIGVNNRDLRTFHTDLATTERLAAAIPEGALLVTESGIHERADVERLWSPEGSGAAAFLIGEAFMVADDPAERIGVLFPAPTSS